MSYSKEALAKYRLERAAESLEEARLLSEAGHWNTTANRLYYACFYATSAYLVGKGINATTHVGVKSKFNQMFIKQEIIEPSIGKIYNKLFNLRQDADYRDYKDVKRDEIEPMIDLVAKMVHHISNLVIAEEE